MILIDILQEHLEEADFLFHQRENALSDRAYDLGDLAELEERLLAHLDGLVLGGKEAWEILAPKLAEGELGEVFAAGFVALESGDAARIDLVQKAFAGAEAAVLDGIRHALRHTVSPKAEEIGRAFLSAEKGAVRAAAIDVLSFRRIPIDAKPLRSALNGKDPLAVAAAVQAAGRLRIAELKSEVETALENDSPEVRREAMGAGLLLKSEKALGRARKSVTSKSEEAGDALILLGLAGHPEDGSLLVQNLGEAKLVRAAVIALGLSGRVAAINPLIRLTADPKLSRLAGEAIRTVTGVDLKEKKLTAPAPPQPEAALNDDEEVPDDPDAGLPFPDAKKLEGWWKESASRFDKKNRYRSGRPHGREALIEILRNGPLPERRHAAFDLSIINPAAPLLETAAFAGRQQKETAGL
jgi:uncharacterized protein (TIGR02270 family)